MKNKKINITILLVALAIVLYFTLKDNFIGIINELANINVTWFILSILIFLISLLFKSISLYLFIRERKKNYTIKNAFSLTLIGQFLNGITPFQSGGQPFQIYLLKKDGIRLSDSTSSMIKDFISFQIALILMGFISIFINNNLNIIPKDKSLYWLICLGFLINIIVLIVLLLITTLKNLSLKIINKLLDFLYKFNFFKKFNITKEKINDGIDRFYKSALELKKNKKVLVISIITNIINLVLLYIIPFIIFKAFDNNSVSIVSSIVSTAFIMLIGNFIPIPGATGGIEYGFISFFSNFNISSLVLSGAMLLWRFVTYFFGMLIGFIVLIIKQGVDNK